MNYRPHSAQNPPLSEEERSQARRVGERLRAELDLLVRWLPAQHQGGAAMARLLNIDRSTCQRVLQATRSAGDALEVLVRVPGIEGLKLFTDAFAGQGVAKARLNAAREALDAFAHLIDRLAGSQTALIKRIQSVGTDRGERLSEETEAALREQAFEAISQLTGSHVEQQANYLLIRPVPGNDQRAEVIGARDMVSLAGRSSAPPVSGMFFARAHQELAEGQPRPVPLDSSLALDADEEGSTLLPEFCSDPLPKVISRRVGDITLELIEPPGSDAKPLDVALAYRLSPSILHPALQANRKLHLHYHSIVPTRRVLLHAYLHRSMAGRCLAEAFVHQRSVELLASEAEPWFDQLDQRLVVEILGSDLAAAGRGASPRQETFLAHLFRLSGWNPGDFVGFRLALDCPIWSCRYTMSFEFAATDETGAGKLDS